MLFTSLEFLVFFLVVFITFFSVPLRFRLLVLLGASLCFIGVASPVFLIYSVLFVLANYSIGRAIGNKSLKYRQQIYYLGQVFNIGGLVFYKYINFIVENINTGLNLFTPVEIPYLTIIIPLGISYYTFQGISYLYLIFKANDKPETDLASLALYMLFFPKIMAGPIERHRIFLPQLRKNLVFDYDRVVEGGRLVLWGMFKKVVVGDTFAIILNKVYGNVEAFPGQALILTFLIQPVQIYCDFSGYTDMAIGFAKIFGINLSPNFNRPFFARSVSEFWRRWHISLSSWCNEFIYNRLLIKHRKWGNWAVVYAIFGCFMIIGVWHGANWTFVMLGIIQVFALTYEFFTRKWRSQLFQRIPVSVGKWISITVVYLFVCLFLIFFFAKDLSDAFYFLSAMPDVKNITNFTMGFNLNRMEFYIACFAAVLVFIYEFFAEIKQDLFITILVKNSVVRWCLYIIWVFMVVYFSKNQSNFVYMMF